MEIIYFLAVIYLFTLFIGILLEEIRIPWIFAALILGVLLAAAPFPNPTHNPTFSFLADMGMYFLLFLIGFEIDLKELLAKRGRLITASFTIILLEGVIGSLLIHFVFGYDWIVSLLVAVSFATVGEAMLLPILDEFDLLKTELGQTIVSIGVIDDAIEILAIIGASILLGAAAGHHHVNTGIAIGSLAVLFALTYGMTQMRAEGRRLKVLNVEDIFLFTIFIFFLFLGVGMFAEAAALGAVMAGIAVKNFIPDVDLEPIENDLKSLAYGLFGPLFFVWVGAETDIGYLVANPLLVLLVVVAANSSKIVGSWLVARNWLGTKQSIFMGVSLSVRFSTSIVLIKLLHDGGVIANGLYSVLIASTIVFKFLVPFVLAALAGRWQLQRPT